MARLDDETDVPTLVGDIGSSSTVGLLALQAIAELPASRQLAWAAENARSLRVRREALRVLASRCDPQAARIARQAATSSDVAVALLGFEILRDLGTRLDVTRALELLPRTSYIRRFDLLNAIAGEPDPRVQSTLQRLARDPNGGVMVACLERG